MDEQEDLEPEIPGVVSPSSKGDGSNGGRVQQANVVRHGEHISISWRTEGDDAHRSLSVEQLNALAYLGSQLRAAAVGAPAGWKEVLRTLGQLLDSEDLEFDGVFAWEGTRSEEHTSELQSPC